jgi:hypothetical protein
MTTARATVTWRRRGIGPLATALRIAVALGLLYLAGRADGVSWDVEWYDLVGGLVALPGLILLLGLAARRYAHEPIRFTGPAGHALNCVVIVALVANPYTGGAATLFYAAMLLVAAWRGQHDCEVTVLPNWILGRDDQIGCPMFAPIDALAAKHRNRRATPHVAADD